MPTIDIKGTSVAFPFKPYDCQLDYIGGVLEALNDAVCCSLNERCVFFKFSFGFSPLFVRRPTQRRPEKWCPNNRLTKRSVASTAR